MLMYDVSVNSFISVNRYICSTYLEKTKKKRETNS